MTKLEGANMEAWDPKILDDNNALLITDTPPDSSQ
jgi:hypothetical protein